MRTSALFACVSTCGEKHMKAIIRFGSQILLQASKDDFGAASPNYRATAPGRLLSAREYLAIGVSALKRTDFAEGVAVL